MMNDEQLLRYSRHILLNDIDMAGQETILAARILIIGAGGLAHPAITYLVSSGVGQITIIDNDTIEISNLQRQYWFSESDIGQAKATVLCRTIQPHNPEVRLQAIVQRADEALLSQYANETDLILDCTDNMASRRLINRFCFQHRIPLISASALVFSGQLAVYDFRQSQGPCYQCLFNDEMNDSDASCAKNGVFAPLLGIMGAAQAAEALKLLTGLSHSHGYLHCFDARQFHWQRFKLNPSPSCPVCGTQTAI